MTTLPLHLSRPFGREKITTSPTLNTVLFHPTAVNFTTSGRPVQVLEIMVIPSPYRQQFFVENIALHGLFGTHGVRNLGVVESDARSGSDPGTGDGSAVASGSAPGSGSDPSVSNEGRLALVPFGLFLRSLFLNSAILSPIPLWRNVIFC